VKFRYAIGGILVAALLLIPSGATARGGGQVPSLAAQQCAQERAQLGKKAFLKRYGEKHAAKNCMKRMRGLVATALPPASTDCQDELAEDPVSFIEDYGETESSSIAEAMQECVAEGVDMALHPEDYVDDGSDEE
jgi:hypothetical protein